MRASSLALPVVVLALSLGIKVAAAPAPGFGDYIVAFKEHVSKEQIQKCAHDLGNAGGSVGAHYDLINAFKATIPDNFLGHLKADNLVEYIEVDSIVTI